MEKINCDVCVVGAGPGGSVAAKTCAKYGLDTVLVERKENFKRVKFAQVSHRRIFDYIKIDDRFVDAKIRGIKIISPDGTEVEMHEPKNFELFFGINRGKFDEELAKLAVGAGAEFVSGTTVTGLIKEYGGVKGVKTKTNEVLTNEVGGPDAFGVGSQKSPIFKDMPKTKFFSKETEIRSNLVIRADGIESNLRGGISSKDADSCIEYLVGGVDLDREYIYYRIGEDPFETFYMVPKGEDKFAIDFFSLNFAREDRINLFIRENLPEANVIEKNQGSIPFGSARKELLTNGLMLVGDCAGCASPLSRFGVLCAMDSGVLAGETAVEAHEEEDFSSDFLARYEHRWHRLHGARNDIEYKVRKFLMKKNLSREDVNSLFHILKDEDGVFTDALFEKLGGKKQKQEERDLFEKFRRYDDNIWDLFVR